MHPGELLHERTQMPPNDVLRSVTSDGAAYEQRIGDMSLAEFLYRSQALYSVATSVFGAETGLSTGVVTKVAPSQPQFELRTNSG